MKTIACRILAFFLLAASILMFIGPAVQAAQVSGLSAEGDSKIYLPLVQKLFESVPTVIPETPIVAPGDAVVRRVAAHLKRAGGDVDHVASGRRPALADEVLAGRIGRQGGGARSGGESLPALRCHQEIAPSGQTAERVVAAAIGNGPVSSSEWRLRRDHLAGCRRSLHGACPIPHDQWQVDGRRRARPGHG